MQHDFLRMRGGRGQRPFGTFPKVLQFWWRHPSRSRNDVKAIYVCSLDFDVDSPDVAWEEKLGNNKKPDYIIHHPQLERHDS